MTTLICTHKSKPHLSKAQIWSIFSGLLNYKLTALLWREDTLLGVADLCFLARPDQTHQTNRCVSNLVQFCDEGHVGDVVREGSTRSAVSGHDRGPKLGPLWYRLLYSWAYGRSLVKNCPGPCELQWRTWAESRIHSLDKGWSRPSHNEEHTLLGRDWNAKINFKFGHFNLRDIYIYIYIYI